MSTTFIVSIIAMGGLGLLFAGFLVVANSKLKVEEDPLVEKILDALPGTNCGACGVAGCHTLAEQISKGEAPINACPAGGAEVAELLADILGVDGAETTRILAVVLCRGGAVEAVTNAEYRGDYTCSAAHLTGGEKVCSYSCLGYGECVDACDFDAMAMNDNGLPVIFNDKCVGCGACARACPRDIIEMHPENRKLFVYCKNHDKGPVAKKGCKVACIACTLCVKDSQVEGGIVMKNNLAVIDYEICHQNDAPTKRCPTKCILFDEESGVTSSSFYSASMKKAEGE